MPQKQLCPKTTKVCHETKESAIIASKRTDKLRKDLFNVYRCQHCKKYHIGSTNSTGRFQNFIDKVIQKDKERILKSSD